MASGFTLRQCLALQHPSWLIRSRRSFNDPQVMQVWLRPWLIFADDGSGKLQLFGAPIVPAEIRHVSSESVKPVCNFFLSHEALVVLLHQVGKFHWWIDSNV